MKTVNFARSSTALCLTMGISMSLGMVIGMQSSHAQSMNCVSAGSTVPEEACVKFVGAKPAPNCPAVGYCGNPNSSSSSGGDDDDDDDNAGYRDTDGDGVGDTYTDSCSGYCSEERGEETDPFYDDDASDDGQDDGDNDGGGDGDSVLCTYFYQKGILEENLYYADIENARSMISPVTMRGYHYWSINYVRYIRKHPGSLMEKMIRPIVVHRAQEVAYQLGVRDRADYIGKLIRMTFEPTCFVIGIFAEKRDWRDLYNAHDFQAFADGYRRYKSFKAERALLAI